MASISRREFLAATTGALGGVPLMRARWKPGWSLDPPFLHGVASGDPLVDRVILWTRVLPGDDRDAPLVAWEVARDTEFKRNVARGELQTGAARDFTVKVDVTGLQPGTTYYYRFVVNDSPSPIGRTRTLPAPGVSRVRLGVASCANYPYGYFNAYACLARRADLDAIVHLGDYIYEGRGGRVAERILLPARETLALADYRERHAQYKTDPDLQEVHRQHPFIVVWDDHEIADNAWVGGAAGHTPETEGDWFVRRAAALQAYFEWMPVREDRQTDGPQIYRTFRFGGLTDLIMLDTRIVGRDKQVLGSDLAGLQQPSRTILGSRQEQWLARQLAGSVRTGTPWQVLGQQVIVVAI